MPNRSHEDNVVVLHYMRCVWSTRFKILLSSWKISHTSWIIPVKSMVDDNYQGWSYWVRYNIEISLIKNGGVRNSLAEVSWPLICGVLPRWQDLELATFFLHGSLYNTSWTSLCQQGERTKFIIFLLKKSLCI